MSSVSSDRRQGVQAGAAVKVACKAVAIANITLSGEQTVNSVACVTGDRVLVTAQTDATANGIYECDTGDWQRTPDFDGAFDAVRGTLVPVYSGGSSHEFWAVTNTSITFGTTNIAFTDVTFAVTGVSAYIQTLLDDTTAEAAAATLLVPSLADLADTTDTSKGDALVGGKRAETGAQAFTLHESNQWRSLHVLDVMSASERADVIAGTASVDVTASLRIACTALQANGGGILDFGNYRYKVYNDTSNLNPLGDFSSLRGIELRASGAEFVITGNFEAAAAIAALFKFTACNNITIGDFKGSYTGTARSEIFTRGGQFGQFEQGCTNIQIGNLDLSDWALAVRFQKLFSDPVSYRCRNIRIANIKGTSVGYQLTTDNSGDELDCHINSASCGRSWIAYNPKNTDVVVRSKNQIASSDCLLYAFHGDIMEEVDLHYTNTETTNAGGGTRIGVSLVFRDGDVAAAIMRNVEVKLNVSQEAGGFLTKGLLIEKLKADATVDTVDRGHKLQNLKISGSIDTSSGSLELGDRTTWGTGEFVSNPCLENLFLDGGQPSLDFFTSLQDSASLRNIVYDSSLNVSGNSTGKITCIGVKATNITRATSDTALMDYIGCNISSGNTQSFINKNYLNTYVGGTLQNSPFAIIQNSQSSAYTTAFSDANKHILHPTADNNARTFTIDSNANVAYPVGTQITFVNQINTVTIAITSDTLTLMGAGSTGNRTLAANGIATALKVASTSWVISGTGLT